MPPRSRIRLASTSRSAVASSSERSRCSRSRWRRRPSGKWRREQLSSNRGAPIPPPASSVRPVFIRVAHVLRRARRGRVPMSAAIHGCSLVLAHAPDLVRHGSKPTRELAADRNGLLEWLAGALRSYDDALGYPPHQVFLGNLRPDALWETQRPWWRHPADPKREGPFGVFVDEADLYRRMAESDQFQLFRLNDGRPAD